MLAEKASPATQEAKHSGKRGMLYPGTCSKNHRSQTLHAIKVKQTNTS